MVDIFILVVIIIISIILLFTNIYLLAYYCTEKDNNYGTGIITKLIVIIGMFITIVHIGLVPLDVSNTIGEGGNFRMDLLWKITYILIFLFGFFIIPIAISIYEHGPDISFNQKFKFYCFYILKIIIFIGIFILSFLFLRKAKIPLTTIECEYMPNNDEWMNSEEEINDDDESMFNSCQIKNKNIEIMVSFIINAIGILNIISNLFFMFYGGVGLLSLPIDLLNSFCTRPDKKLIKNSFDHEQKKEEIALFAADLKGICMKLKKAEINGDNKKSICSKSRLKYENLLKQLKICVSIIEDQYEIINFKSTENKNGAIGYLMKFFLGIFSLILSIIWILHIIFYIILKKNEKPFFNILNVILIKLTKINLSFVSIGIYFLLSLYLLFITIKGNFKIRSRIFYLGIIYPLKKNNSYMNSILFNVKLIMITSISVVQLFLRAFSDYTSMTDASLIFNVQIKYLLINGYLCKFNIVEYGFFSIAIISFIYLIISTNEMDRMKKLIYMKHLDVIFDKTNEERFIINPGED